jgi:DNA-binding MarR family transcriptional regulator
LMATIVLPYRGSEAAARELERRAPRVPARRRDGDGTSRRPLASASPVDYRLTVRTQMALAAVAGRPGLSNREVSEIIGLSDQGQVSRMMRRLSDQGLVENTQGHSSRHMKAWRLTADGEAVIDAHRPLKQAQRKAGKGGKLATTRSASCRRGKQQTTTTVGREAASTEFRMTALTHEVLVAVAALSNGEGNPSNRALARAAKVKDEGQISKLLRRLEAHDLLQNTSGHSAAGNAWRLTARGKEIVQVSTTLSMQVPTTKEQQ